MSTKTYIEKSRDKEILNHILLHIVDDTSSQRENEFARAIEKSTDRKITKQEFHDWIADFDVNELDKQFCERESKKNDPNIRVGDWVSFYRAVAPGGYVTNAIIARVISISECPYIKGTKIYNTDQGPVGEKHILQSTRLSDD